MEAFLYINNMKVLKCKDLEEEILSDLTTRVQKLKEKGVFPALAMISVGNDPASETYVTKKEKTAKRLGIQTFQVNLPKDMSEDDLLKTVIYYSYRYPTIVQLPLPSPELTDRVIKVLSSATDVDGFTSLNVGRMMAGEQCFIPATPKGILAILRKFNIPTEGKNVAVVGRSNIVGRPLANLLSSKEYNATVTLCHSHTQKLSSILKQMDIVIVATGNPATINVYDLKPDAVVIDVGVNRVPDNSERGWHLEGDFDKTGVENTDISYTPVPGGVGLLTVAMLMENTVEYYELGNDKADTTE